MSDAKKVIWTAEDRARHKAIREQFDAERPTLEQLVASGEYAPPLPQGEYLALRRFLHSMRVERERQGLSLADVAPRMGIDKAAVSRLETGARRQGNPTLETLSATPPRSASVSNFGSLKPGRCPGNDVLLDLIFARE